MHDSGGDFDSGGRYAWVQEAGDITVSSNFAVNPKIALKSKVIKNINESRYSRETESIDVFMYREGRETRKETELF